MAYIKDINQYSILINELILETKDIILRIKNLNNYYTNQIIEEWNTSKSKLKPIQKLICWIMYSELRFLLYKYNSFGIQLDPLFRNIIINIDNEKIHGGGVKLINKLRLFYNVFTFSSRTDFMSFISPEDFLNIIVDNFESKWNYFQLTELLSITGDIREIMFFTKLDVRNELGNLIDKIIKEWVDNTRINETLKKILVPQIKGVFNAIYRLAIILKIQMIVERIRFGSPKFMLSASTVETVKVTVNIYTTLKVYKDEIFTIRNIISRNNFKNLQSYFGKYIGEVLNSQIGGLLHALLQDTRSPSGELKNFGKIMSELLFIFAMRDPIVWYRASSYIDIDPSQIQTYQDPDLENDSIDEIFTKWAGDKYSGKLYDVYEIMNQLINNINFNTPFVKEAIFKYLPIRNFLNEALKAEVPLINLENDIFEIIDSHYNKNNRRNFLKHLGNLFDKKFKVEDWKETIEIIVKWFKSFRKLDPSITGKILDKIIIALNRIRSASTVGSSLYNNIQMYLNEYKERTVPPDKSELDKEYIQIINFIKKSEESYGETISLKDILDQFHDKDKFLEANKISEYKERIHSLIVKKLNISNKFDVLNFKSFSDFDYAKNFDDFNKSSSLNVFDIFNITNRVIQVGESANLRHFRKYKQGTGDDINLNYFGINRTINQNYEIGEDQKIRINSKLGNWLSFLVQSEILEFTLILSKIFIYDKTISWEDRLSTKSWFIKTKIFLDLMPKIRYRDFVGNIYDIVKPKNRLDVKRFCKDIIKKLISNYDMKKPPEKRENIYTFSYLDFKYKRYIMNFFFLTCFKKYYNLGDSKYEFYKVKDKNLKIAPWNEKLRERGFAKQRNDLDRLLYVNDFHPDDYITGRTNIIAGKMNELARFKVNKVNVKMATKQEALIYNILSSKGLDFLLWKLSLDKKITSMLKGNVNLLTSTSVTLKPPEFPLFTRPLINQFQELIRVIYPNLLHLKHLLKYYQSFEKFKFENSVKFFVHWIYSVLTKPNWFFSTEFYFLIQNLKDTTTRDLEKIDKDTPQQSILELIKKIHIKTYHPLRQLIRQFFLLLRKLTNWNITQFIKVLKLLFNNLKKKPVFTSVSYTNILVQLISTKGDFLSSMYKRLARDPWGFQQLFQRSYSYGSFVEALSIVDYKQNLNVILAFSVFIDGPKFETDRTDIYYGNYWGLLNSLFEGKLIKSNEESNRVLTYDIHSYAIRVSSKFRKEYQPLKQTYKLFKRLIRYYAKQNGKNEQILSIGRTLQYL